MTANGRGEGLLLAAVMVVLGIAAVVWCLA